MTYLYSPQWIPGRRLFPHNEYALVSGTTTDSKTGKEFDAKLAVWEKPAEEGHKDKEPLVFIAGFAWSGWRYKSFLDYMKYEPDAVELRQRRWIVLDLPGVGRSPGPEDPQQLWDLEMLSRLVGSVLSRINASNGMITTHSWAGVLDCVLTRMGIGSGHLRLDPSADLVVYSKPRLGESDEATNLLSKIAFGHTAFGDPHHVGGKGVMTLDVERCVEQLRAGGDVYANVAYIFPTGVHTQEPASNEFNEVYGRERRLVPTDRLNAPRIEVPGGHHWLYHPEWELLQHGESLPPGVPALVVYMLKVLCDTARRRRVGEPNAAPYPDPQAVQLRGGAFANEADLNNRLLGEGSRRRHSEETGVSLASLRRDMPPRGKVDPELQALIDAQAARRVGLPLLPPPTFWKLHDVCRRSPTRSF